MQQTQSMVHFGKDLSHDFFFWLRKRCKCGAVAVRFVHVLSVFILFLSKWSYNIFEYLCTDTSISMLIAQQNAFF